MGSGAALTVIVIVVPQPPASVYVKVATPAMPPVTTPLTDPISAVPEALLLQVPGVAASL
jgi:hypothetical protein